ncbi:9529_t:CDS:2, partial [Entrophospora sp. SA101]
IAKKLRTGLQFAYFKVKWGLQNCDISTSKAVFEILDSLVKRPKSSSPDINDSTDNINHYNNKRIITRKRCLNNNDRISSTTESASLSSFDASSLEQTLPPFFPIEVNPNSIELYLNSLERNYGAYGNNNNHHSWTLMNYGSPTIKNSSLSSSCRRKVDCGEDSNRAIKNQKIQKTTVEKLTFLIFLFYHTWTI